MNDRHMGPIEWCGAIFLSVAVLMVLMGGAGGSTTNSHNNNHSELLSRNKIASDNQINILSEVHNYYGDQAGQTNTVTAPTWIDASGQHNSVSTDSVGNRMCWNEPSKQYVYSPCPQVTP